MDQDQQRTENSEPVAGPLSLNPLCSRRQALKWGGVSAIGISVLGPVLARGATKPLIIMEQAQGILVADPVKCVGCGRCELACTEFNDGRSAPVLSGIKVSRNLDFGAGNGFAWRKGEGNWGNGLIVADLCKQCPHPVPCANICPEDAIVVAPSGKARMVDLNKCNGCKICLKACPWEMISFDPESNKVTKCHLCDGKPKCVEACPAGSLSYVPWRDLTDKIAPRVASAAVIPPKRAVACEQCHLLGEKKVVGQGIQMLWGGVKEGKPISLREFGFKWIGLGGTILLPLALLFVVVHAVLRAVKR